MITNSAYFEISILSSVVVAMVVLAMQSPADPPSGDLGLTLRILEIFVTIYLSAEMALEYFSAMTRRRELRWLRSPWTWIEVLVLVVSWGYLLAPESRLIDVCRVLRVLRPIRSLRLFHSVGTIGRCFAENMRSFIDVSILMGFLLFLSSLVGVHMFNGAIQSVCLDSSLTKANITGVGSVSWQGRNITVAPYCPPTLRCAVESSPQPLCTTYASIDANGDFRPVGEDETGFRGFDALAPALLTMFIHMTADEGMNSLPDVLADTTTLPTWAVWTYFALTAVVLSWVCMNLVLAVTLGAFNAANTILLAEHFNAGIAAIRDEMDEYIAGPETDPLIYEHLDHKQRKEIHSIAEDRGLAHYSKFNNKKGIRVLIIEKGPGANKGPEGLPASSLARDASEFVGAVEGLLIEGLNDFAEEQRQEKIEAAKINWDGQAGGKCREAAKLFVTSHMWNETVTTFILLYVILLVVRADGLSFRALNNILIGENVLLGFFFLEIVLRLLGLGIRLFFKSQQNMLDMLILMLTIVGVIATGRTTLQPQLQYDTTYIFFRLLRVSQVLRILYKVESIYKVMRQVMKSWKALLGCIFFMAFSITMAAIVAMHLLGGGLGRIDPDAPRDGDSRELLQELGYPRRNFETFSTAVLACIQVMLSDNWTEVMLWYMENGRVGAWAAAFFPLLYIWVYGVLFNTFVAVLLLNFSTEESDKIPLQRKIFWSHDDADDKPTIGMFIAKETSKNIVDDDTDDDGDSLALQLKSYPSSGFNTLSLFLFAPSNPVRLQCAEMQSSGFLKFITSLSALVACVSLVQQGKEVRKEERILYDSADYIVIGVFAFDALVKSVQGGFVFRSGPTAPFLSDLWNRLNCVVLAAMLVSILITDVDDSMDPYVRLLRGILPMVGLMQI
eukprot:SAG31_NODE_5164_length_2705_cov_1.179586_1_plen_898_part_01